MPSEPPHFVQPTKHELHVDIARFRVGDVPDQNAAQKHLRHAAFLPISTASNVRPSPSSLASRPVYSCHRRTMTSANFSSSSISRADRPTPWQAMSVDP